MVIGFPYIHRSSFHKSIEQSCAKWSHPQLVQVTNNVWCGPLMVAISSIIIGISGYRGHCLQMLPCFMLMHGMYSMPPKRPFMAVMAAIISLLDHLQSWTMTEPFIYYGIGRRKEWMMEGRKKWWTYTPQSVFPPALLHVQSCHSCHWELLECFESQCGLGAALLWPGMTSYHTLEILAVSTLYTWQKDWDLQSHSSSCHGI